MKKLAKAAVIVFFIIGLYWVVIRSLIEVGKQWAAQ